jgi:hypothetical protein
MAKDQNNSTDRPMSLREAKKLVAGRLRDKGTDAKSFTRLVVILGAWSHWKRTPRAVDETSSALDSEINQSILRIEEAQRKRKLGLKKPTEDQGGI